MRIVILVSAALLLGISSSPVSAQGEDQEHWTHRAEADSSGFWELFGQPSLSIAYGFATVNRTDLAGTFRKPRLAELTLGSTSEEIEWGTENIVRYHRHYGIIGAVSNDLGGGKGGSGEITADLWRFGVAWDKGYGYALGSAGVIGYTSFGLLWSRLDLQESLTGPDSLLLAPFDETFRFGTRAQTGIRVRLMPLVALDASYERSIVFPAHLFWKWLGSEGLHLIAQEMVDRFVDRVLDSSPGAAPVVSFVLKGGLAYAAYELRKEKMNYPFDSDPPLRYDIVRVGASFTF